VGLDANVGDMVLSPQGIIIDRECIQGAWYVVLKIDGHGALKFSPDVAHNVARALVGQSNAIEKMDSRVIVHPWRKFRG
jgi:hypothetical protein